MPSVVKLSLVSVILALLLISVSHGSSTSEKCCLGTGCDDPLAQCYCPRNWALILDGNDVVSSPSLTVGSYCQQMCVNQLDLDTCSGINGFPVCKSAAIVDRPSCALFNDLGGPVNTNSCTSICSDGRSFFLAANGGSYCVTNDSGSPATPSQPCPNGLIFAGCYHFRDVTCQNEFTTLPTPIASLACPRQAVTCSNAGTSSSGCIKGENHL